MDNNYGLYLMDQDELLDCEMDTANLPILDFR